MFTFRTVNFLLDSSPLLTSSSVQFNNPNFNLFNGALVGIFNVQVTLCTYFWRVELFLIGRTPADWLHVLTARLGPVVIVNFPSVKVQQYSTL